MNAVSEEKRRAIVEVEAAKGTAARSQLSAGFSELIGPVFRENLFDVKKGFGASIPKEWEWMYVSTRRAPTADDSNVPSYFEYQLFKAHCCRRDDTKDEVATGPAVIIVRGTEGIGKSTFLHYYFSHYLRKKDEQRKKASLPRYERGLALYSDLRRGVDKEKVLEQSMLDCKNQIEAAYPNLSVEDDYAMWSRLMRWDNVESQEGEKVLGRAKYRATRLANRDRSDLDYVAEALWYLDQTRPFRGDLWLPHTIIFDNLDQHHPEVQRHLVEVALDLAKKLESVKLILPLRPETVQSCSAFLQPLEETTESIDLGSIDHEAILTPRYDYIRQAVIDSKVQVGVDWFVNDPEGGYDVFVLMSNAECCRLLDGMLRMNLVSGETGHPEPGPAALARSVVEKLCNRSIRRLLRVRRRLAESPALEKNMRRASAGVASMSNYAFVDGLLSGRDQIFNVSDEHSDILNLFDCVQAANRSAYTTQVALVLLSLLRGRRRGLISDITKTMLGIGFHAEEIEEAIDLFRDKGLLVIARSAEGPTFAKEPGIVEAHTILSWDSAYIDNAAIVTPLEREFLVGTQRTVSYEFHHFLPRIKTSLQFLRQLQKDEYVLRAFGCEGNRMGGRISYEEFQQRLDSLSVPSTFHKAAKDYKRRLDRLRARVDKPGKWGLFHQDPQEYARLISDPVLDTSSQQPTIRATRSSSEAK